ncbi:tryptophan-rich sensory protein [Candidatus Avelusimicrobium faecicola]|uniref:TspO/MBR family protein n=1 Tax=Candidatus Avelusimicrobium faecicola TaxID=3416205 RepID=UPI0015A39540
MKTLKIGLKLFFWLFVCQLPGLAGARYVPEGLAWYHTLTPPPFTPPDYAFGLAWGLLYILIGISAWLALRPPIPGKALGLFLVQLLLNACWTPLFFGQHQLGLALLLLGLMVAELVFLVRAFGRLSPLAGRLLWPYGAWLLFACYLNAGFWLLNA